ESRNGHAGSKVEQEEIKHALLREDGSDAAEAAFEHKLLVGSREELTRLVRERGPACCILWVQGNAQKHARRTRQKETAWSWKWRRRSSKVAIEPGYKVGPASDESGRAADDSAIEVGSSASEEGQVWVSYRLRSDEVYHRPVFSGIKARVLEEHDTGVIGSNHSTTEAASSHGFPSPDKSGELRTIGGHSSSKGADLTRKRRVGVCGEEAYERLRTALTPGGFVDQLHGVLANLVLNPAFLETDAGHLDLGDGAWEGVVFDGECIHTLPVGRGGQEVQIDWKEGKVLADGERKRQKAGRDSNLVPGSLPVGGGRDRRPPDKNQVTDQVGQNQSQDQAKAGRNSGSGVASSLAIESLAALRVACASTPKERCALSQLASHIPALKARGIITMLEAVREDEALLGGVTGPLNSEGDGGSVRNKRRAAEGREPGGFCSNGGAVRGITAGEKREGEVSEASEFQEPVGAEHSEGSSAGKKSSSGISSERPMAPPVASSERSAKQFRTRADRKGAAARALNAAMRERVSVSLLKRAAWVDQGVLAALAGAVFDGELFQRLCQERALLAEVTGGGGVDSRSARSRREGGVRGERRSGAETARTAVVVDEEDEARLVEYVAARCCWLVEASAGKATRLLGRLVASKLEELTSMLTSRTGQEELSGPVRRVVSFLCALQRASPWTTRPLIQAGAVPALFGLYGQLSAGAFGPSGIHVTSDRPREGPDGSLLPGSVNRTGPNRAGKLGRNLRSGGQTGGHRDEARRSDVNGNGAEFRTVGSKSVERESLRNKVLSALLCLLTRGTPRLALEEGAVAGWMRALVDGMVGSVLAAEEGSRGEAAGARRERSEQIEGTHRSAAQDVIVCTDSTMKIVKRLDELGAAASEALWKEMNGRLAAGLGLFTLEADGLGKLPERSSGKSRAGAEKQTESSKETAEVKAERSENGDASRGQVCKEETREAIEVARGGKELRALFRVLRELLHGSGGHRLAVEIVGRCGESLLAGGRFLAEIVNAPGSTERPNVAADRPAIIPDRPVTPSDRPAVALDRLTTSSDRVKAAPEFFSKQSDRPTSGAEMEIAAASSEVPDCAFAFPLASQLVIPYVDLLAAVMGLIPKRPRLEAPAACEPLRSRAECPVELAALTEKSSGGLEGEKSPTVTSREKASDTGKAELNEEGSGELRGEETATVSSAGGASESGTAEERNGADVLSGFLLEALGGANLGGGGELGASSGGDAPAKVAGKGFPGTSKQPRSVACLVPFAVDCLTGTRNGTETEAERSRGDPDTVQKAADIVGSVRRFLEQSVEETQGGRGGWIWAVLLPWLDPEGGAALRILRRDANDVLQKEVLLLVEFAFSLGAVSKADDPEQAARGFLVPAEGSPVLINGPPNPFHVPLFTDAFLEHHVAAALRLLTSPQSDAATCPSPPGLASRCQMTSAELCALHLRVVTAIARGKLPGAVSKLYQLGVMGRLVEQIGLEHESTLVALPSPLSGLKRSAISLKLGDGLASRGQNGELNISLDKPKAGAVLEEGGEEGLAEKLKHDLESEKGGDQRKEERVDIAKYSARSVTDARASGGNVTPVVPRLRLGTLQSPTTGVKPLSPIKATAGKSARLASPGKARASSSRRGSLGDKENVAVDGTRAVGENGGGSGTRAGVKLPKLALSKLPANGDGGGAKSPIRGVLSPGDSGGVQMSAWSSRLYAKDPSRKHLLSPVPAIPERNSAESVLATGKAISARGARSRREPLPRSLTARVSLPSQEAVLTPLSARKPGAGSVSSRKDTWHDLNDEVERQMGVSDPSSDSDASDGTCSDSEPEGDPPLAVVPLRHSDVVRLENDVAHDVIGDKIRSTMSLESSCSNVWDDDDKESSWESRSMGSARIAAVGLGGAQMTAVASAPAKRSEPFMARVEREALAGALNASAFAGEEGRTFGLGKLGTEAGVKPVRIENLGAVEGVKALGLGKEEDPVGVKTLNARPVPRLKLPLAARKDQTHKDPHHAAPAGGWVSVTKPVTEVANPPLNGAPVSEIGGRSESGFGPVQSEVKPTSLKGLSGPIDKVPKLSLPTRDGHVSAGERPEERGSGDGRSVREAKRIAAHYEARRAGRMLYREEGLHVAVLELILCMMTSAEGDLEPLYSDNLPTANRRLNAPFFLFHHLNHPANAQALQTLCARARALGAPAERILRLTCQRLFTPGAFPTEGRQRIAEGASAHVVRCRAPAYIRRTPGYGAGRASGELNPALENGLEEPVWVALKMVNVPGSVHDPCVFHDLYSEVAILEKLKGDPSACQLYDYGVDENCYYLVLKHYPCSLKEWRLRREFRPAAKSSRGSAEPSSGAAGQGTSSGSAEPFRGSHGRQELGLYLEVFAAVLEAASNVAEKGIIHFDLKCDNVLLEPLPGVSEERFWGPPLSCGSSAVDSSLIEATAVDFATDPSSAVQTAENRELEMNPVQSKQGNPSKAPVLEPAPRSRSVHKFLRRLSSKPSNRALQTAVQSQVLNPVSEILPLSHPAIPVSDGVKPRGYALPFRVVLADFGQSKICRQSDVSGGVTVRNRGTEFVKSPEMLTVFHAARASEAGGPKKLGAGKESDVWSLGCLLYELLVGDFLFYDEDWVRFFIRVTSANQELISSEKAAKLGNDPAILDFLRFALVQDPSKRPSLAQLVSRFDGVRAAHKAR
ncbi:hypothetical protein KFL_006660010, partial [Klebsormidium nitens]